MSPSPIASGAAYSPSQGPAVTSEPDDLKALLTALRAAMKARDDLVDELDELVLPPASDDQLWEKARGAFLRALSPLIAPASALTGAVA